MSPEPDPDPDDAALLDSYSRTLTGVAASLAHSVAAVTVFGRGRDGGRRPAGSGSAVAVTADGYLVTSYWMVMTWHAGAPPFLVAMGYYRDSFVQERGDLGVKRAP